MPFSEISNPLQAAIDVTEKASVLGVAQFVNEYDLRMMGPDDEYNYIHSVLANQLADHWLKTAEVQRCTTKKENPHSLSGFGIEYKAEVVLLSRQDFALLKSALAAAVRKELAEKELRS